MIITSASCLIALSFSTSLPLTTDLTNPPPETNDFTFQADVAAPDTLATLLEDVIAPAPVEPPVPGQLWQGWGVDPQATPAQSCDGFFANIPRTPLACYPETPPAEETINTLPAGELAYRALALTKIEGAGLKVQPHIRAYVGVPTLVHATHPTRETTVELLSHPIHITFTASSYTYTFNDGSAPLVTTDPSGPFPISRLRHIYHQPFPTQTITLETIWSAHITHPTTGQIITLNNALTTRETSQPFEVRKAKGYLTDTAEELKGR